MGQKSFFKKERKGYKREKRNGRRRSKEGGEDGDNIMRVMR